MLTEILIITNKNNYNKKMCLRMTKFNCFVVLVFFIFKMLTNLTSTCSLSTNPTRTIHECSTNHVWASLGMGSSSARPEPNSSSWGGNKKWSSKVKPRKQTDGSRLRNEIAQEAGKIAIFQT